MSSKNKLNYKIKNKNKRQIMDRPSLKSKEL